jgi:uncharacterized membrane protein
MRTRVSSIRDQLRTSFWFTPALMVVAAVLVAGFTLSLDDAISRERLRELPVLGTLVYSGGPDGAREVLSAVAGSMITVAGVVFSITMVALTLASGQYGPRLMDSFVRDRGNQLTLGTFIATFVYSLLVLRTVRSDRPGSVPDVSVTCSLLFALAGLAVLIYFINHVAQSIQASNLVAAIGEDVRAGVDAVFPDVEDLDDAEGGRADAWHPPATGTRPTPVLAGSGGYVQLVDLDALVALADQHDLRLQLEVRPGRFVVPSSEVVQVWASACSDEVLRSLAGCVVAGARRTPMQDVEFPIRQLSEVAVRALSPAINDPFTAQSCVDQLSVGLCEIAGRRLPPRVLLGAEGTPRLRIGDPVTFARLVSVAYAQIRQCAAEHVPVYLHLLQALDSVAGCTGSDARREVLRDEARLTLEAARSRIPQAEDLQRVEDAFAGLPATLR